VGLRRAGARRHAGRGEGVEAALRRRSQLRSAVPQRKRNGRQARAPRHRAHPLRVEDRGARVLRDGLCADSLGARLAREGPLPEADIVHIARDIAQGLAFAHGRGVIHRDLKPDNILLRSDGRAVITDFGIARAVSGYVASTGFNMTIGTPQYLSPEQAQGARSTSAPTSTPWASRCTKPPRGKCPSRTPTGSSWHACTWKIPRPRSARSGPISRSGSNAWSSSVSRSTPTTATSPPPIWRLTWRTSTPSSAPRPRSAWRRSSRRSFRRSRRRGGGRRGDSSRRWGWGWGGLVVLVLLVIKLMR